MSKSFPGTSRSMIETILVLLLLLGLMLALYDVLKVFFGVLTFALIFSVSFADIFEWLARVVGNRRKLAATIYTLVLIAIVALPIIFIISALRHHVKEAIAWMNDVRTNGLPPLPAWISGLPIVGEDISTFWQQLQSSPRETIALHGEPVKMALRHILTSGAGMIGTAFIASVISWIGLIIAGVHYAVLLSALIFFLVLIQLGPLLVWVPLVIWTASQGHTGMTIFLDRKSVV